jgi:hypothetical protein
MDRETVYTAVPEDSDNQIVCQKESQSLSKTLFQLYRFTPSIMFSQMYGEKNKIFLAL